ncbi:hypothetical protein GLOIN_2v1861514 [Rhizophagus clarus]|uniref:G-protein coupled receptors family 2 profile 2 domain-containing protein n=1 Tax=Rhizophagus clarus TaxID=94130 RepID=A0A8H3QN72_9GLOM|nr:hypothetical protein GLOIN_2v1861514 [Rhizophagus clarus]
MKSARSSWLIILSMLIHSVLAQSDYALNIISKDDCPPPLIVRDSNVHTYGFRDCLNDCCLACPFANNFYEENKLDITYKSFAIFGIISFFLMILLGIFFIVLPSQKQNHLSKLILLPLALSVMCFEGAEFFTLNQKQSQCADSITPANSNNNARCAVQAFFTLAGSCAIACYSSLLMTHLHLVSVWRNEFITKHIGYFHALIFGGSLAAFVVPYITHNIQATNICFISLDSAPAYFYFLFFIYIAFAAHLTTLIHMAHITIKSNRRYSLSSAMSKRTTIIEAQRQLNRLNAIFKMQWRALLGALLMLIIYVLNWHFYVFGLRVLTKSVLTNEWVVKWIQCLKDHKSQSICAHTIETFIPSYNYILTLLFFNRTAGILIFIIFAAKRTVLLEVYDLIRGKKPRDINQSLSFNETEFRSIRGSINNPRMSYRTNHFNYKNDMDNVSNMSECATLTPSESVSNVENNISNDRNELFRKSETSVTFSYTLQPGRNSIPSISARNSLAGHSILKKEDT